MTVLRATATAPATSHELMLENECLRSELRERVAELRACRGQVVQAIDAERRRIERDLHDGMQGRLVSLAMSLGLLESMLPEDPEAARPVAQAARRTVAAALAELRELSQGIYPLALAEQGLAPALEELCERTAVPAHLAVSLEQRLPAEIEAAGYFLVNEALTNAVKHAHAAYVRITVTHHARRLALEIVDNGIGGAAPEMGSGLRGLADRIEALGGWLTLSSPSGCGTTIRAEVPSR